MHNSVTVDSILEFVDFLVICRLVPETGSFPAVLICGATLFRWPSAFADATPHVDSGLVPPLQNDELECDN